MSPSIASIVTPFRSPAVLSMSPLLPEISSTSRSSRCLPRCLASEPASLLHARGQALLFVLAQLFLRVELPAALLALEELHGCSPFCLVDQPLKEQRTCQRTPVLRNDRNRGTCDLQTRSIVLFYLCVTSRRRV